MRNTVLKVNNFKGAFFRGSKGGFVKAKSTKDKSQEGIPLSFTGLSL